MESHLQSGTGPRERLVLKMNTTHPSSPAAEVPAYAQLQREIRDALRAQHPDWILPNGDCPTCDSYESRLAELLTVSLATERAYEHNKASNILRGPWPLPARDLDDAGNFSMPAEYAQARNIVFPEVA
jgi:hypothetical protein